MALSRPFKEDSPSASSFRASLLQAIDGVMSLTFVPAGFSSTSNDTSDLSRRKPLVYLLCHFPALWHIQGSTSTGVFEGGRRLLL